MQPNEITLAVNVDNDDGTTPAVDYVYSRFEEFQNRASYIHALHSLSAKHTLTFYRTFPKPTGNYKGVAKTALKFSVDKIVDGVDGVSQLTSPMICEVGFSLPVGITPADSLELRQMVVAIMCDDDIMAALNDQQQV